MATSSLAANASDDSLLLLLSRSSTQTSETALPSAVQLASLRFTACFWQLPDELQSINVTLQTSETCAARKRLESGRHVPRSSRSAPWDRNSR